MELDLDTLRALAASQNVPVHDVADVVAAALTDAYAKSPGALPGASVELDDHSGTFVVVDQDEVTHPMPAALGRTAAAAARQAIVQWMRDQERRRKVGTWAQREGTAQNAVVVRHVPARGKQGPETQLRIDGTDAVLPAGEAIAGEELHPGQQVQVLLLAANVDDRDRIKLTVSRRQPALVSALFDRHVPELADGQVTIVSVARDPGSRTKVAYTGTGGAAALVGPSATRIRAVMAALGGEKLDLVERHEDLADFVAAALTPGKVQTCELTDPVRKQVRVTVLPDQALHTAGRGGANISLAQRLTGARIQVDPAA